MLITLIFRISILLDLMKVSLVKFSFYYHNKLPPKIEGLLYITKDKLAL